jgi:hypothetical protein
VKADWEIITRFCNICHECSLLTSEFKSSKICISVLEIADAVCDTEFLEACQDDSACENGRSDCFRGDYWTFVVRAVLRAISVGCFYHVAFLSHDAWQRAWIGLSFEIFHCQFSLDLSRAFCVPRHSPLRTDRRIAGFLSVILKDHKDIYFTWFGSGFSVSYDRS